jgi:hypothetical protein
VKADRLLLGLAMESRKAVPFAPRWYWTIPIVVVFGAALLLLVVAIWRMRNPPDGSPGSWSASNLGQIALAAHNFHNDHGYFPYDGVELSLPKAGKQRCSLFVALLPYLDAKQVYDNLTVDQNGMMNRLPPLKVLVCPGRSTLAQAGRRSAYGWYANPSLEDRKYDSICQGRDNRGVTLRELEAADGAEHTIFFAHLGMQPARYGKQMNWPDYSVIGACQRTSSGQLYKDVDDSAADTRLGSSFIGSTPVVMANRVVRPIRYSATVDWNALWGWKDGVKINLDALE